MKRACFSGSMSERGGAGRNQGALVTKSTYQLADMKVDALQDAKAAAQNAAHRLEGIIKADDPKAAAVAALEQKAAALKAKVRTALDNPGTAKALLRARVHEYDCVKTPAEYAQAFLAGELRCVDSDLYGRIGSHPVPATSLERALDQTQRPVGFWTGSDGLQKYAVISRPPTVGLNMPSDKAGFAVQSYSSANFSGLFTYPNGQNLISGVGYSAADWAIDEVYTLVIVSRAAVRAQMAVAPLAVPGMNTDVAGIAPTWADLKALYEYIYADEGLVIPESVIAYLERHTFREVSGCPAQCSYHAPLLYPSAASPRLVVPGVRVDAETCAPPNVAPFNTTQMVLVPPTAIDATALAFCNAYWNAAYAAFCTQKNWCYFNANGDYRSNCSRNMTASVAMATDLKALLASTADVAQQAAYFRYFLSFGCQGNMNTLFTGNGYTAAGVGGLFAGQATEWLFSALDVGSLPPDTGYATVQFCLGVNDGVPSPGCGNLTTAKP